MVLAFVSLDKVVSVWRVSLSVLPLSGIDLMYLAFSLFFSSSSSSPVLPLCRHPGFFPTPLSYVSLD
jgi:hypothetical protein